MFKEFYFPIAHRFAILSLMKCFEDFVINYFVTMRVNVNVIIYQWQHIMTSKFWKITKKIQLLSHDFVANRCCVINRKKYSIFFWWLLLLHTVEHIDIGLCGQAEPNLWKIFYCWEVLLIWNSLSLPAIDMKNWLKYGTILWKRLRTDWFLWTLSVYN